MKYATFAAGCFWGVEEAFLSSGRVLSTRVGYCGGGAAATTTPKPTYELVCKGNTGHAEAVEVTYDPNSTSYDDLLKIFWKNHDPTTLNRQGFDVGEQYRSAIFYHDPEQKATAELSRDHYQKELSRPIVTQILPITTFYPAEDYHQQYLRKSGRSTCHI